MTELNQPTTITDKLNSFKSDFKSAFTWCCAVFEIHIEKLIHMTQSATQIALIQPLSLIQTLKSET